MQERKEVYKLLQNSPERNKLEKYLKDFDEFKSPDINDIWRISSLSLG